VQSNNGEFSCCIGVMCGGLSSMKYVVILLLVGTFGLAAGAMIWRTTETDRQPRVDLKPAPVRAETAPTQQTAPVQVAAPAEAATPVKPADAPLIEMPGKVEWVLKHEMDGVVARSSDKEFATYYKTTAGTSMPLSITGEEGHEQFLAISEWTPHNVRWEIEFAIQQFKDGWNKTLQCSKAGFYLVGLQREDDPHIETGKPQTLVIERSGTQLRYMLNNAVVASFAIAADDRTALKAISDNYNITVTAAKLFYNAGEEQSAPPQAKEAAPPKSQWKNAFKDNFSDADAASRIFQVGDSKVEYHPGKQALLLNSGADRGVYAALHQSLPGDLRVRFKALRSKKSDQVSIGLVFGARGKVGQDGYFAEWARGIAQLKRQGHVVKRVDAPTPQTPDRWVNIELLRVGGTVTLSMEGKELLTYTEEHPLRDSEHDLCAFYVWSDQTLIRDVSIDRDANDAIKPLPSDPATKANIIDGTRSPERGADF
jgi:hypothetical protein